jgi:hypothetical protein
MAGNITVLVNLLQADDLRAADSDGKSDPYVELTIGKEEFTSEVIKDTLNPFWGAPFTFGTHKKKKLTGQLPDLKVKVLDKNTFRSEKLGTVMIPLNNLAVNTKVIPLFFSALFVTSSPRTQVGKWYTLEQTTTGRVRLEITIINPEIPAPNQTGSATAAAAPAASAGAGQAANDGAEESKSDPNLFFEPNRLLIKAIEVRAFVTDIGAFTQLSRREI